MPPRAEHLVWVVPQWWVPHNERRTAISRDELVRQWVKQPPKPFDGTYRDALHSWCVDATTAAWTRGSYTAAIHRIRARRTDVIDDIDGWNGLSALLADCLDAFARCSVSFTDEVKKRKPKVTGRFLPSVRSPHSKQLLSEQLTAAARTPVATAARRAMVTDDLCGRVLDTAESADLFLSDPGPYRLPIRAAAMRAYGEQLLDYASRLDDETLFGDTALEVRDALMTAALAIEAEFGDLTRPPRRPTKVEQETVGKYVEQWVPRWLAGEDSTGTQKGRQASAYWPRIKALAVERTVRALVKACVVGSIEFVDSGNTVSVRTNHQRAHAVAIFWSSVTYAKLDVRREVVKEQKESAGTRSFDDTRHHDGSLGGDEVAMEAVTAAERGVIPAAPGRTEAYSTLLLDFDLAAQYLENTDDRDLRSIDRAAVVESPCWEKSVAIEILTGDVDELVAALGLADTQLSGSGKRNGDREFEENIANRRSAEDPPSAMGSSPKESGRLVRLLLAEAISGVRADRHRNPSRRTTTDAVNDHDRRRAARERELS